MKKLLITLIFAVLTLGLMAQENHPKGIYVGKKISDPATSFKVRVDSATSTSRVTPTDIKFYRGSTQLNPDIPAAFQIDNATVFPELADTIPLVTFGTGSGLTADTALFNNNVLIGTFYNEGSDTLVITQLMGILKEGTGTETIAVQISWHATMLSGSATSLNAAALAITSMTTGTADVSFANAKIPPNVFVWGILSGASTNNKPTFLSVTLSGYKIPKY